MTEMSKLSNREVARIAQDRPGVWVTLRSGMASANLVTQINSGERSEFDPKLYQARSSSYVIDGGRRIYDIEVMYAPRVMAPASPVGPLLTLDTLMSVLNDPEVQRAVEGAIARLET